MKPCIAAKKTRPRIRPPVKPRLRKRLGTTSGSRPALLRRDSYRAKTAKTATEAAIIANDHTGQSCSRPCTSG